MGLAMRISELRRNKGQSLQQVADAVGVSKAHIWELEKGRTVNPSLSLVINLADHFGVSVAFLASEDVESADADPELQGMFRQAQGLEDRDRHILRQMMQSMLAKPGSK